MIDKQKLNEKKESDATNNNDNGQEQEPELALDGGIFIAILILTVMKDFLDIVMLAIQGVSTATVIGVGLAAVGQFVIWLATGLLALTIAILFYIKFGASDRMFMRQIKRMIIPLLVEMIPVLEGLPMLTVSIIIFYILDKNKTVRQISQTAMLKHGLSARKQKMSV